MISATFAFVTWEEEEVVVVILVVVVVMAVVVWPCLLVEDGVLGRLMAALSHSEPSGRCRGGLYGLVAASERAK